MQNDKILGGIVSNNWDFYKKSEFSRVIIYSEISWDFLDQRHHHLARFLAKKGMQVIFVERVVGRVPEVRVLVKAIKNILLNKTARSTKKEVPKGVSIKRSTFLPYSHSIFSVWNHLIWFLFHRSIQKNSLVYSFVDSPYVIGGKIRLLALYKRSVFDIIHNWWEFPWRKSAHRSLVEQSIKLFDFIVTDSPQVQELLSVRGVRCHLLLPGVDEIWFEKPQNVQQGPESKRAVFFGNLRANSDLHLLEYVNDVLGLDIYGVIDESVTDRAKKFNYRGSVPSSKLPGLVQNYAAITLPYDKSEFSATITPAKLFEALASGRPVISGVNFDRVPQLSGLIYQINSYKENVLLEVIQGHTESNAERQRAKTRGHSWDSRFEHLLVDLERTAIHAVD